MAMCRLGWQPGLDNKDNYPYGALPALRLSLMVPFNPSNPRE